MRLNRDRFSATLFTPGSRLILFGACLAVLSACDGGDDAGDPNDDGADASTAGDGDGDGDGDDPDRTPTTGEGDGDGDDPTTGGFGGTGGELEGCAVWLDAGDCVTAPGCAPVFGQPLVEQGGSWCEAAEEEYIGCVSTDVLCPALPKTLCDGDGYWQTTACVPDNVSVCDAPGDVAGDC